MPDVETFVDWLSPSHARIEYSQFGEEGLVESILFKLGYHNCWCFEVGCSDGTTYSNVRTWIERGWSAVLIDANPELCDKASELYKDNRRVKVINATIDHNNPLDQVLMKNECPSKPDFGVIDIDGADWWLWSEMTFIEPRVIMVEFKPRSENGIPAFWDQSTESQAGFAAIRRLGEEKGYYLLAKTHVNAIFMKG